VYRFPKLTKQKRREIKINLSINPRESGRVRVGESPRLQSINQEIKEMEEMRRESQLMDGHERKGNVYALMNEMIKDYNCLIEQKQCEVESCL
jgi:hypothetical protein